MFDVDLCSGVFQLDLPNVRPDVKQSSPLMEGFDLLQSCPVAQASLSSSEKEAVLGKTSLPGGAGKLSLFGDFLFCCLLLLLLLLWPFSFGLDSAMFSWYWRRMARICMRRGFFINQSHNSNRFFQS